MKDEIAQHVAAYKACAFQTKLAEASVAQARKNLALAHDQLHTAREAEDRAAGVLLQGAAGVTP